jgi:hypothetical protein
LRGGRRMVGFVLRIGRSPLRDWEREMERRRTADGRLGSCSGMEPLRGFWRVPGVIMWYVRS